MLSTECSSVSYGFSIRYLVVFLCKFSVWHKHVTYVCLAIIISTKENVLVALVCCLFVFLSVCLQHIYLYLKRYLQI